MEYLCLCAFLRKTQDLLANRNPSLTVKTFLLFSVQALFEPSPMFADLQIHSCFQAHLTVKPIYNYANTLNNTYNLNK